MIPFFTGISSHISAFSLDLATCNFFGNDKSLVIYIVGIIRKSTQLFIILTKYSETPTNTFCTKKFRCALSRWSTLIVTSSLHHRVKYARWPYVENWQYKVVCLKLKIKFPLHFFPFCRIFVESRTGLLKSSCYSKRQSMAPGAVTLV